MRVLEAGITVLLNKIMQHKAINRPFMVVRVSDVEALLEGKVDEVVGDEPPYPEKV